MRFAAPLVLAGLLATPVLAFTPERAAILVDAVRANGCQMSGEQAPAALEPLGLDAIEVQSFVDILYGAELVTVSDNLEQLILSDALCSAEGDASMALIVAAFEEQEAGLEPWEPDFTPERAADFIAVLRGNGCAMTDVEAGEILPDHEFSPALSRDIVTVMLEVGMAEISQDALEVRLSETLCAADPASDAPAMAEALATWFAAEADDGAEAGVESGAESGAGEGSE